MIFKAVISMMAAVMFGCYRDSAGVAPLVYKDYLVYSLITEKTMTVMHPHPFSSVTQRSIEVVVVSRALIDKLRNSGSLVVSDRSGIYMASDSVDYEGEVSTSHLKIVVNRALIGKVGGNLNGRISLSDNLIVADLVWYEIPVNLRRWKLPNNLSTEEMLR